MKGPHQPLGHLTPRGVSGAKKEDVFFQSITSTNPSAEDGDSASGNDQSDCEHDHAADPENGFLMGRIHIRRTCDLDEEEKAMM
jgi:hypothetical protein